MGSFPLAATQIRQQPSMLEQFGQAMQLKQLMTANQLGQIQLEQAQQDQKDRETIMQAFKDNAGDLDKTIQQSAQKGVSPKALMGLQASAIDMKTKAATLTKDQLDNLSKQHDNVLGLLQATKSASPENKAIVYGQARQAILANPQAYGVNDPSHVPPEQYPGDDWLDQQIAVNQGGKLQFDQEMKRREVAASEAKEQTPEKVTFDSLIKAGMSPPEAFQKIKQMGQVNVDQQEMADWLKKNPGKGPSDYMAYKAKLVPAFNFNLQSGALNDAAKQMAAQYYSQTGQLPAGMRSPAMSAGILNQAATQPGGMPNVAANKATFAANEKSLESLQKNFDQVSAFENTAIKNLDQVAKTGAKIPDLSSRFANVPVRSISANMLGTKDMAAFRTALLTAQTEAAKVLSSANAQGVLSDSARHEAQEVLDGNLPFPAMMASINQLKTDFANRHQSYQAQIDEIKGRVSGQPNQPQAGGKEIHYKIVNGQLVPQ